jgi:large subunit ribosomal protein L35
VPRTTNGSIMPKQKTKRAAMKRFTRTGSGKLKRGRANHTHILTKKTRKRKNKLKKEALVSSADFPRVNRLLLA